MKKLFVALFPLCTAVSLQAEMIITPWHGLFKGIDRAVGTNYPDASIPRLQVVNCARIDLRDPDITLFPTPPASNYVAGSVETYTMTVTNFMVKYGLSLVSDANFYNANPGGSDPNSEGLPCRVYGMQVCTGAVVSLPDTGPDSNGRYASILFTTNKQPILDFNNRPPGHSLAGIYTAVTGFYPILSNNVNIGEAAAVSYPDPSIHEPQPRTIFGLSGDRHYLFVVTIDGRQPGYSDGATDPEGATWLQRFGASDAINMDGGGSTAMYSSDCAGTPVPLNSSSYILLGRGRERIIGSQFGVYAKPLPLPLKDLTIIPGTTTATIRWSTDVDASTQAQYGSTPSYSNTTPLDSRPKREHVVTLTGLNPGSKYYYRAVSVAGTETFEAACALRTTNTPISSTPVFEVTATWKYTTNNLDGINWKTLNYDDSSWLGPGAGLLYIENNTAVSPRTTLLPPGAAGPVMRTYYFRRHFDFTGVRSTAALAFTSYVDDGAVYYLNGAEIYRLRMPAAPTPILNSTAAIGSPCAGTVSAGEAACPDQFQVSGSLLNSLVQGDNVLAVEVHNLGASADIVFGSALSINTAQRVLPSLGVILENNFTTLFWNGDGFTLQKSDDLSSTNAWVDVPGNVTRSPYSTQAGPTVFYRLRQ